MALCDTVTLGDTGSLRVRHREDAPRVVVLVAQRQLGLVLGHEHGSRVEPRVELGDGEHEAAQKLGAGIAGVQLQPAARRQLLLRQLACQEAGLRQVEKQPDRVGGVISLERQRRRHRQMLGRCAGRNKRYSLLVGGRVVVAGPLVFFVKRLVVGAARTAAAAVEDSGDKPHHHHAHGGEGSGDFSFGVEEALARSGGAGGETGGRETGGRETGGAGARGGGAGAGVVRTLGGPLGVDGGCLFAFDGFDGVDGGCSERVGGSRT